MNNPKLTEAQLDIWAELSNENLDNAQAIRQLDLSPAGGEYVVVQREPREPTEAMIKAAHGTKIFLNMADAGWRAAWTARLSAATSTGGVPAMYAGPPIDPGPAGFGVPWARRDDGSAAQIDVDDLTRFHMVYLGSPYTKYAAGIEQAFRDVSAIAAELLRDGVRVYSPIAHTHPIATYGNLDPLNHDIWLPFDHAMMDAADAMVIADMEGWDESYGVRYEIDYFAKAGKPVYFRSAFGDVLTFNDCVVV